MNIDKQTVEDIRFILRQIVDCPAKRRILEALDRKPDSGVQKNGGEKLPVL